jgi:hypothetical protein
MDIEQKRARRLDLQRRISAVGRRLLALEGQEYEGSEQHCLLLHTFGSLLIRATNPEEPYSFSRMLIDGSVLANLEADVRAIELALVEPLTE